jgi:hypothetical protein
MISTVFYVDTYTVCLREIAGNPGMQTFLGKLQQFCRDILSCGTRGILEQVQAEYGISRFHDAPCLLRRQVFITDGLPKEGKRLRRGKVVAQQGNHAVLQFRWHALAFCGFS